MSIFKLVLTAPDSGIIREWEFDNLHSIDEAQLGTAIMFAVLDYKTMEEEQEEEPNA
jgi:hypothetical protein